jgi:hypothetical protein
LLGVYPDSLYDHVEQHSLWEALGDGGQVLMSLGEYPFSERYGWVQGPLRTVVADRTPRWRAPLNAGRLCRIQRLPVAIRAGCC